MFASKTETTEGSTSRVAPDRSTPTGNRVGPGAAEQALRLQRTIGNQATARLLQAKLAIGPVDDPLEREADDVADQVVRMPDPAQGGAHATVQRKCAACEEEEKGTKVRAKQDGAGGPASSEAPAAVNEVLQSSGTPLDSSARAFFEPRFGQDFSRVRLHTDEHAARSAQSIGALAYAVGPHIAFAAGQYSPSSDQGKRLLAHELVHTIQQGHSDIRRQPSAIQQDVVGLVNEPEEFEDAEAGPPEVAGVSQETIQRSAAWKGASVHETVNAADLPFGGSSPITWHMLNGTKLATTGDADGAIKAPNVTTSGSGSDWKAKVDSVPAQEGSGDETVLSAGPWNKGVTKAQAAAVTGLAACSGAGNSAFTAHGSPSDDSVYKANRRHENHHLADHKDAFDAAIGNWDKKVQDAKDKGTEFKGASAAEATAALWTAMGNTPQNAARSYRAQGFSKGAAFHATAAGGPMNITNPTSNADCSTSAVDITNPMP